MNLQAQENDINAYVDTDETDFLTSCDMIAAVQKHCQTKGMKVPNSQAEIYTCLTRSLAAKFANTIKEIENVTQKKYKGICIVGGGARNSFLCRLLKEYSGKQIYSVIDEASAIGNIVAQMVSSGELSNLGDASIMLNDVLKMKIY